MYKIEQFRKINKPENMLITQHSRKRFAERDIKIDDTCQAIEAGEIIAQYPDDHPFPSCLILGKFPEKVLHVVASIDEDIIYVITAYIPDASKWEENWKVRKERV